MYTLTFIDSSKHHVAFLFAEVCSLSPCSSNGVFRFEFTAVTIQIRCIVTGFFIASVIIICLNKHILKLIKNNHLNIKILTFYF